VNSDVEGRHDRHFRLEIDSAAAAEIPDNLNNRPAPCTVSKATVERRFAKLREDHQATNGGTA